MQFESLPEKRAVPSFVRKVPAQSVVLELMKSGEAEREVSSQKFVREQKRADDLSVSLALQVYRKRGSDDAFVRGLTTVLADRQVQMLTYEGEMLTPELESAADIIEWLPADGNLAECIVEAIEPEIRVQDRILHRAKLSCRKAPEREPELAPEQAPAEVQEVVAETTQELQPQDGDHASETVPSEPHEDQQPALSSKPNLLGRMKAIWNRLVSRRNKPEALAKAEKIKNVNDDQESAREGSETK